MTNAAINTGSATGAAYIVPPGTAELRWENQNSINFLATGAQTSGVFCLVDETAVKGDSVPLHCHVDDMESFYVLDGEISIFLGDQPGILAGAGTFAHVPAGKVHGFRIESDTARYLILTTPHHGEFYRALSLPSRPGRLPAAEPVTDEMIAQACADYGIEIIGPLPDKT